ncbi:MAG TPA: aminopeptidase P family protein [Rickettsia endosymbiont of Proechinophthirus fluctus]|uniref:aminopeptidase P family protein n=1 Tax=Rickettsia endosymbiont of Proechinophthirus fluctus TaxID=1462733 RepID=UPI000789D056|nr:aminopeptidase P family protein [Rickettsia endosymbiont of Proechinophthirus fluctus]KYP98190.1 aminopeptidase P [Rickettsia endosymbiont of Proechinophthirus fluctus]HJD54677.1 aminopeptidase P family protein [Rickettsia endosymbiont of Proechinophthirus fluctus]
MTKLRINLLRNLFTEYDIDGYIIPSNDKYMSEYVPSYAKRLEYITGFTGSNGIAIIYKDTALFFTDGRYLEQANKELDLELFKLFDLKDISKFGKDAKIGYDSELFTYPTISNLKFNFQKINGNLVDKIWPNQPLEPNSKVYLHDIKLAGVSHTDKISKCREFFLDSRFCGNDTEQSVLVMLDSSSICWLLNLRASDVAYTPLMFAKVILTSTQLYLFINPTRIDAEIINARPEITILPEEEFENILRDSENKHLSKPTYRIFIDDTIASVHIMDLVADKKVQKITDPCLMLKACKNDVEIKHAIDLHIKDAVALCEFFADFSQCHPRENRDPEKHNNELTEYSLGLKLTEQRAKQEGYVSDSFPAICGFQENSAIIHYRADQKTAKKIEGQGILLIDSGGQYQGATTDITRTIVIGTPTDEQKKRYTQVLKGHIALAKAKFPKNIIAGANLDILARQYLWQEMLDYPHGTGHGVGSFLSVHEGPQSINLLNKTILKAGMILSNEPGFYVPGKYGIRIENLMYVKENNGWLEFETLSLVPYASKLTDMKLLNIDEINYIKEYYNKIRAKIYDLLSTQARHWLNNEINLYCN